MLDTPQLLSVAVIVVMMAAFIWGKFRYDMVAALALLLAVGVGVVPPEKAFIGFSDDIVIIVGSALLVSAGVARSGIMEVAIQRFVPALTSVRAQLFLLVAVVAVLSAFVKNIGALAIMMPIAFQFARRSSTSPSVFLMPMAFGALLGGLMTQIGTSPNIVVSRLRQEITGTSFSMFDFTPVGLALTVIGIVFLMFFYRLLPIRERKNESVNEALDITNYVTEARVTAESSAAGKTLGDLIKTASGDAVITSVVRDGSIRITPFPDAKLREGDRLIVEGDPAALERLVGQSNLSLTGNRLVTREGKPAEVVTIEAVVGETSSLIGWSASGLLLYHRFNVNILAVSRKGERFDRSPGDITFRLGDVVLLQGDQDNLPEFLKEFRLLPLAARALPLGSSRRGLVALAVLATAMGATALGLLPVAFAFFAAAVAMVLFRVVPLREVYGHIDGPILVMLAALIPVSDALRATGATDVMAAQLAEIGAGLPAFAALGLILVASMSVTPFLNNAATVLVMAPIAAGFAASLGFRPEAFLMAVAIGAGCDFLTPIGHQCNTLVMGPGGYRFSDYPRLGLPLSILVIIAAVPLLMLVWPVR